MFHLGMARMSSYNLAANDGATRLCHAIVTHDSPDWIYRQGDAQSV